MFVQLGLLELLSVKKRREQQKNCIRDSMHNSWQILSVIKLLELSAAPLQSDSAKTLSLAQKIFARLQTISVFASSSIVLRRISSLVKSWGKRENCFKNLCRKRKIFGNFSLFCFTCSIEFSFSSRVCTRSKSFSRSASDISLVRSSNFCCSDNK